MNKYDNKFANKVFLQRANYDKCAAEKDALDAGFGWWQMSWKIPLLKFLYLREFSKPQYFNDEPNLYN